MKTNRKRVLEGLSHLGWGKDIECTFFGALDATMRFLGERGGYIYLMGVSAAAFRLRFHQPDWCPSSPDAALDETYVEPALSSVGYKGEFIDRGKVSQEEINRVIREEIDKRIPVVAIDLIQVSDWGVITGYQDGGFLCRSYYDKGKEYSLAEKDPWAILKLEKVGPAQDKLVSARKAFRLAVKLAHTEKIGDYANGLAAYDAWVKDLENEDLFTGFDEPTFRHYWHVSGWVYDSLFDARLAAARYLRRMEREMRGDEKELVGRAAAKFEDIEKTLFDNWIYFTMPHWVGKEEAKTWTPKAMIETDTWTEEMRRKGAEALGTIKGKEEDAFALLGKIA